MKTFRVGDYIREIRTGKIKRVVDNMISTRGQYIRTYPITGDNGGCLSVYYEKLKIKFALFKIKNNEIYECRHFCQYPDSTCRVTRSFYSSLNDDGTYMGLLAGGGYGRDFPEHDSFKTIEDARDWLELEYAKMLAERNRLTLKGEHNESL